MKHLLVPGRGRDTITDEPETDNGLTFDEGFAPSSPTVGAEQPSLGEGAGTHPFRVVSGAVDRYRRVGRGMAVTDCLSILAALIISYVIRWGVTDLDVPYAIVTLITPPVWLAIFRANSLHSPQLLSSWEEFRRTVAAIGIGMVFLIVVNFTVHAYFSRLWLGLVAVFVTFFELASRQMWHRYLDARKRSGHLSLRTLIIGSGYGGHRLAQALRTDGSGFTPIGYIRTRPSGEADEELPVLGNIDDLVGVVFDYGVDCVFLADPGIEERDLIQIAQVARQQNVELRLSAYLPEILSPRLTVQPLNGIMTLAVKPVHLTGLQTAMKRAFDLVTAGIGVILISPFMAAIALMIRIDSKGGVLFKQHRVTKGGHIFKMYKFRTMREDARGYVDRHGIDTSKPFFKLGEEDPRITRVGAFLRKTSLDELPQLLNVLKGEMSLVGPRPLPAEQVAANLSLLGPRHEVPAGLTGWWQIQGRSEIEDPDEAVRMDLFYIENWSLSLDLYVLLKTFGAVVAKRGAY